MLEHPTALVDRVTCIGGELVAFQPGRLTPSREEPESWTSTDGVHWSRDHEARRLPLERDVRYMGGPHVLANGPDGVLTIQPPGRRVRRLDDLAPPGLGVTRSRIRMPRGQRAAHIATDPNEEKRCRSTRTIRTSAGSRRSPEATSPPVRRVTWITAASPPWCGHLEIRGPVGAKHPQRAGSVTCATSDLATDGRHEGPQEPCTCSRTGAARSGPRTGCRDERATRFGQAQPSGIGSGRPRRGRRGSHSPTCW